MSGHCGGVSLSKTEKETAHRVGVGNVEALATLGSFSLMTGETG
jgi:hypothetical protein